MGLLMEERLWRMAGTTVVAWLFKGSGYSTLSFLSYGALVLQGAWYSFLLFKTLKASSIVPMLWAPLSKIVVGRYLSREEFFGADGAPAEVAKKREAALDRLQASWQKRYAKTKDKQTYILDHFSDLRFKASGVESTYPIFQKVVNDALHPFTMTLVDKSDGCEVIDADGVKFLDASGSYGVNCFGYTKAKEFLQAGQTLAQQLGPCLGPMHSVVAENIELLCKIFNKEEASFHMSGTEAVMSAVYQVRFHTQRPLTAVFQGAYHGWWDGVMQGAGNDRFASDCLVLKPGDEASLELLELRKSEINSVLVNPISGFGWGNATTSKLKTATQLSAGEESYDKFREFLKKLRDVCTRCDIPLVFDETWSFQLGPGGAQEFLGIQADILALGKSIGGGHAAGVVLGPKRLMERRDPERPMRVNFVVGTFKGNPIVMGSMNAALKYVQTKEAKSAFDGLKNRTSKFVVECNKQLKAKNLPISVHGYRSTWCIAYHQQSPFHFMFQYYLRDAGLLMPWVGTGKMLFNLEYSDDNFKKLIEIIVTSATAFKEDGWWWEGAQAPNIASMAIAPTVQYHIEKLKKYFGMDEAKKEQ
eukprot:TRINITY_DN4248_c0_g1_i1.p1 TRINITY_DN4248_c0_g1~~TRINITY_DN4248_c0_g1_i1.p1  ORF type:complete len:588 (-),score=135.52 TRINITY_DN4248_c0_g1_i1:107-1870(-)